MQKNYILHTSKIECHRYLDLQTLGLGTIVIFWLKPNIGLISV